MECSLAKPTSTSSRQRDAPFLRVLSLSLQSVFQWTNWQISLNFSSTGALSTYHLGSSLFRLLCFCLHFSRDLHLLLVIQVCSQWRFRNSQQGKREWEVRNEWGRTGATIDQPKEQIEIQGFPANLCSVLAITGCKQRGQTQVRSRKKIPICQNQYNNLFGLYMSSY